MPPRLKRTGETPVPLRHAKNLRGNTKLFGIVIRIFNRWRILFGNGGVFH